MSEFEPWDTEETNDVLSNSPLVLPTVQSTTTDLANPATPPPTPKPISTFKCPSCGVALGTKKSLNRHIASYCPIDEKLINKWCVLCRKKVPTDECQDHFQVEHDVVVERIVVESGAEHARQTQMDQIRIGYRMSLDEHIRSTGNTKTFVCSKAQPLSTPRKSDKVQAPADRGLLREAISCPCFMRVCELPNGQSIVEFCGQHSHEPDINWVPLDPDTENKIVDFLNNGRSTRYIINHFKDLAHAHDGPLRRADCIDSTDISNVKARRIEKPNQLDPDDLISTKLVVEKLQQETPNPIFHFEPADGAIGIATPRMKKQFYNHAARGVLLDSTHGLAAFYHLLVFTIMIVNEFALGEPVAFLIIREESANYLTPLFQSFYNAILEEFGNVPEISLTMTDDAMATWNAWQPIFVLTGLGHRLCLWHIRRAYKTKLKSLLGENSPLYKMAKGIMQKLATSVDTKVKFDFAATQMLEMLRKHGHSDAADYLFKQYLCRSRADLWGLYNHIDDIASTNMYLESMHNKVKTVIMERSTNYRGDELIVGVLLPFAKSYALDDKIHRIRKGFSWQSRVNINIRRHKEAIKYIKDAGGSEAMRLSIKAKDNSTYVMRSKSTLDIKHTITVNETCIGKCSTKCPFHDACNDFCQCRLHCTCDVGLSERWQSSCVHCHVIAMIFKVSSTANKRHDQQIAAVSVVQSDIEVDEPSTSRAPMDNTEKRDFAKLMTTMQSTMNAISNNGYDDTRDMTNNMARLHEAMALLQVTAEEMGVTEKATMYGKRLSKPVSNRMEVQMAYRPKKKKTKTN